MILTFITIYIISNSQRKISSLNKYSRKIAAIYYLDENVKNLTEESYKLLLTIALSLIEICNYLIK